MLSGSVLVLGGGGMVGRNLVRALISSGFETHAAIRPGTSGERLPEAESTVHEVDIRNAGDVEAALRRSRAEVVFNLARSRAEDSAADAARADAVNAEGVALLLAAAAARPSPPRIIHLGTALEGRREGAYAASKARGTSLCLAAARDGSAPVTVLRPVSLYGPYDPPGRLIPSAIRAAWEGGELALTAPGVRREWLYVGDLVEACLLAADGRADGEAVDLGTGEAVENRAVAELAARAAGGELRVVEGSVEPRPWDGEALAVRPNRAAPLPGWRPSTALEDGLLSTAAWMRDAEVSVGAGPAVPSPSARPHAAPELSVVVPAYQSAATLPELARRVSEALGETRYELVLVDDASPDASGEVIDGLAVADDRVTPIHLPANLGQHAAVLAGMREARGERIAIVDADLQDPPEAIPDLLERSRAGAGVVFAARRGSYEGRGRLLTSRVFKRAMSALVGLPPGSGMFMVLDRDAADSVLELAEGGPPPFVVAMAGRCGASLDSIPVERSPRQHGASTYSPAARARSAVRGLRWALWRRRGGPDASRRRLAHNELQRSYYAGEKPNMEPRPSRYLERHVDELVRFTGLEPGQRLLEVGCGLGRYTLLLARRGFEVEGIDISPELLERLRASLPADAGVRLHLADVLDPPPELQGRFDGVIGGFVLHHLHDVPLSLASIARLARPGGSIAFLEPNPFNLLYYLQMATSPTMTWRGDKGVLGMRRRRLLDAMRAAGVSEPGFERFGFFPPSVADRPRAGDAERRIESIAPLRPFLPFQLVGGRLGEREGAQLPLSAWTSSTATRSSSTTSARTTSGS